MLYGSKIPELANCVDTKSIRVYAPTPVLLLCGGQLNIDTSVPAPSFREALTRVFDRSPFNQYAMLLAEQVNAFYPDGDYADVLSFEADIAQISELILLFSESFGSAAELGAFVMYDEIAAKLLVVIDDKHYSEKSFIRLGPIRYLEKKFGADTVCVINRNDVGISSIYDLATLNVAVFTQRMGNAVDSRKERAREHTTFNPERPGHIIKLMVGLIQHYGALYIEEVEVHVAEFGVRATQERLTALLLCAELVDWIRKDKRGTKTYYAAKVGKDAISYKFRAGVGVIDKERWRAAIAQFWETTDPDRYSSIQSALGSAS